MVQGESITAFEWDTVSGFARPCAPQFQRYECLQRVDSCLSLPAAVDPKETLGGVYGINCGSSASRHERPLGDEFGHYSLRAFNTPYLNLRGSSIRLEAG